MLFERKFYTITKSILKAVLLILIAVIIVLAVMVTRKSLSGSGDQAETASLDGGITTAAHAVSAEAVMSTPGLTMPAVTTPAATEITEVAVPPNLVDETEEDLERCYLALVTLRNMTLEEKVGQMFIARCPDTDAIAKIGEYHLGGYLLFAKDFERKSADDVRAMIRGYQEAAAVPMFIGVDEEGGIVNRVSSQPALRPEPFASPQAIYEWGGLPAVREDTLVKSRYLKDLGINVNFAPVADVSTDPADFIYARTLGRGAAETADYVSTVVTAMRETAIGSVLKHFPGYGGNIDNHTNIARDDRPMDHFRTIDFPPFAAGITSGADAVMVAHNIVEAIDPERPASLSPEVHRILREDFAFDGMIVTDELSMAGVSEFVGDEDVAVLAVLAGNDLLCCTDFETRIAAVVAAVRDGRIPEETIDLAALRVLRAKERLGILK